MYKSQLTLIRRVNTLLIKRFGIPLRPQKLPNPLEMLIATILSQNTNDKNSFRAFENLKTHINDWNELLNLDRVEIENLIKQAGLGKQKSAAIKRTVEYLNDKYGSVALKINSNTENEEVLASLTDIKGVGIKTASCVLLFSLGRNICPVDTHVHRTLNRIGIVKTNSPEKTFYEINENFPENIAHSFHTNLIRLGREICKPNIPACGVCPLNEVCNFKEKCIENVKSSKPIPFMLLDNV
ncbi:MAG: endonuclease III [Bacteroidetes bacterium]|nr:endonuclease III [Bacteroidota bacterium]MBU1681098.1 endonuclease III [Bacteroidota bacterium]